MSALLHISRPRNSRGWAFGLVAASGLALCLLSGCSGSGENGTAADSTGTSAAADSTETADSDSPKAEKAIKVDVGAMRLGDLVLPVYADGAIRTPQSVMVRTKAGGELMSVLVRDGDRVKKGQVLARIDPREYQIALEESRYRHLQALSQMAAEADTFTVNHAAMAAFTTGRDELDRMVKNGIITRDEYQNRILELEMSSLQKGAFREAVFQQRTGLAEARMAEERARLNLEYTEIRAPFAGIVQGMTMVNGEIVSVGTSVCTIFNNENLEAPSRSRWTSSAPPSTRTHAPSRCWCASTIPKVASGQACSCGPRSPAGCITTSCWHPRAPS